MFYLLILIAILISIKFLKLSGSTLLKTCLIIFWIASLLYIVNLKWPAEIGMRVSLVFGLVGIITLTFQLKKTQ